MANYFTPVAPTRSLIELPIIYTLTEALLELRSTKALAHRVRRDAWQERHWSGHMSAIGEQPGHRPASYV
jgi:hypothetical protein